MITPARDLKDVLRTDFLWFASILMLVCGVLVTALFYFNVSGRLERERIWLESYSQSFLKDLQLGDVASVEAKTKRFAQRHGFDLVQISFGENVISSFGNKPKQTNGLERPFELIYAKISGDPIVKIDLIDPVGTMFGTMTVNYNPQEFYRSGIAGALVVAVTFVSLLLVIIGLYARRLSDFEDPFLSLFNSIRRMKAATEGSTTSIDQRLEKALVNTGISEMDLLQKEFASSLASTVRLQDELNAAKVATAIARTTQALAHDVRKPFSMFKSIIQAAEEAQDATIARDILRGALPEINQAMASVEGMIQDVMQIGSDALPNFDDIAPEALIESALLDVFRIYPEANFSIEYNFAHRHLVSADSLRVARVFSNIFGNALQAVESDGKLWVSTRDLGGFIEFTIGNSGSVVPPENIPKLFDAFFTAGKNSGTGLGLAIVKKIVELHGGVIRCQSEVNSAFPDGRVEFVFTLPAAQARASVCIRPLPATSYAFLEALNASRSANVAGLRSDPRESELEREILRRIQVTKSKPVILFVDDEAVYRKSIGALLERSPLLASSMEIISATNDKDALSLAATKNPCLVIEDIDLGCNSENGLEVVKKLRQAGFGGQICIHSNRFLFDDNKIALEAGANSVFPKPMSKAHLLTLILASIPERPAQQSQQIKGKANFAYIDDSKIFLRGMSIKVKNNAVCHEFLSSSAFLERVEVETDFLESLDFIITDFQLSEGDVFDGMSLATEIRKRGYMRPILLSSNGDFTLQVVQASGIDAIIPKALSNWGELQKRLENIRKPSSELSESQHWSESVTVSN